jgi:hypothetical protein
MTRATLVVALLAIATAAAAQQPPPAQATDRPPEFSCSGQPLDFTREELEQKAVDEVARRGNKLPAHYTTMLKRWGCDWWVFVLQQPAVPGADFGVLVDGISGAVKQYIRR